MNSPNSLLRATRTALGKPFAFVRPLIGSIRAQITTTRRDIHDLTMGLTQPAFTFALMAVFSFAGRDDLAAYALIAPMLMGVAGMAVSVASEVMTRERDFQTLELTVASPAPIPVIIFSRIMVITSISLLGIVQSWLIIRFVFGVDLTIHHPWLFAATMLLTAFAAGGTALITAALFCFAQAARTFQNSITFPAYLFSGILVPIAAFPDWLEPVSRVIFLYWSGTLLRDAMQAGTPEGVIAKLGVMLILGGGAAFIGGALIVRMLNYLRREGTLGVL